MKTKKSFVAPYTEFWVVCFEHPRNVRLPQFGRRCFENATLRPHEDGCCPLAQGLEGEVLVKHLQSHGQPGLTSIVKAGPS